MGSVIKLILVMIMLTSCQKSEFLNLSLTPLKRGTVMDPARIYFLNEYYLIENLSTRLVEMDSKSGYKFMLASKIEQDSDLEYRIQIRTTHFSNGDPLTLEDVKASFERALSKTGSHVQLKEIVSNLSIQNNELKIKLKKKVNDFIYFLTLADLSVLHHTQVKKDELKVEDWENVTSGPYVYNVQGDDFYLVKNPYFKLSSVTYPSKIKLLSSRGRDTFEDFKQGLVDLGEFNLNSYDKHIQNISTEAKLQIIGNTGDMINFLALNADHSKFKDLKTRRWIQKRMMLNFELDSKYNQIARKAYQFYTPLVRGFVPEEKIKGSVENWTDVDLSKVPEALKDGITIHTYQRAFEVTPKGAFAKLSEVLGIPVKIEATVPSGDFEAFIKKKDYEIFLGVTAMDQVIVGESINLYYFSSFPMFKDVNGEIKILMDKYQTDKEGKALQYLNDIAHQMISDAECIPVFYVASPFFYNKEKLDLKNLDEMTYFNFWKIQEN